MPFYFVDPEVYRQYRDRVVEMAQSIQINYVEHLPAEKRKPGFSDEEIAEKLGLDARTVSEIRCVAEREMYDVDDSGPLARLLWYGAWVRCRSAR